MKQESLTPEHLEWLVKARTRNQTSALELFRLFESNPRAVKSKALSRTSQSLVAACFSLWRAAFLADKTGTREAVFQHARSFLERLLADNAITYLQDRNAREWTFNYYMNNAKESLLHLSERWPEVEDVLSQYRQVVKGTTTPQRRWDRYQDAFETAVRALAADLKKGA